MTKIAIRFSDNDFWYTFRHLLRLMEHVGLESYAHLDKAGLVDLLNKAIPGVYFLVQNRLRPDCLTREVDLAPHISNYLKLTEKNIYIDDEVDVFVREHGHNCNRDFHILDTNVYLKSFRVSSL
jgi:hypothetical protein